MEDGSGGTSSSKSRREARYRRFFDLVEEVVSELQELPGEKGDPRRRLGGVHLEKLKHSVETLIRESVAVVLQRKRKGEAAIHLSSQYYGPGCPDLNLSYNIHVKRAYEGMIRLGYLEEVRKGYFDRTSNGSGNSRSRLTRYIATDRLIDRLAEGDLRILPVIVPPRTVELVRVKVKDEDGHRHHVPFERTAEVDRMSANLELINRVLLRRWGGCRSHPDGIALCHTRGVEAQAEGEGIHGRG